MHDVLEGVLQYECKLLLQYCICIQKFFKLPTVNNIIEGLSMGYMEAGNRPAPISEKGGEILLQQKGNVNYDITFCQPVLIH